MDVSQNWMCLWRELAPIERRILRMGEILHHVNVVTHTGPNNLKIQGLPFGTLD